MSWSRALWPLRDPRAAALRTGTSVHSARARSDCSGVSLSVRNTKIAPPRLDRNAPNHDLGSPAGRRLTEHTGASGGGSDVRTGAGAEGTRDRGVAPPPPCCPCQAAAELAPLSLGRDLQAHGLGWTEKAFPLCAYLISESDCAFNQSSPSGQDRAEYISSSLFFHPPSN